MTKTTIAQHDASDGETDTPAKPAREAGTGLVGLSDEFSRYTQGMSMSMVGKLLHRTDRTVRDWKNGRRPMPHWALTALRLRFLEEQLIQQQLDTARQTLASSTSESNITKQAMPALIGLPDTPAIDRDVHRSEAAGTSQTNRATRQYPNKTWADLPHEALCAKTVSRTR